MILFNVKPKPEDPSAFKFLVQTNSPGDAEKEWTARGFRVQSLYARPFHPGLCGESLWALSFWRPETVDQPELL